MRAAFAGFTVPHGSAEECGGAGASLRLSPNARSGAQPVGFLSRLGTAFPDSMLGETLAAKTLWSHILLCDGWGVLGHTPGICRDIGSLPVQMLQVFLSIRGVWYY